MEHLTFQGFVVFLPFHSLLFYIILSVWHSWILHLLTLFHEHKDSSRYTYYYSLLSFILLPLVLDAHRTRAHTHTPYFSIDFQWKPNN